MGRFYPRRENLLIFGKPGSGKSHCLCALGEQLIQRGRSILLTTCSLLVQQLLIAKRDLRLPKLIKKLSRFDGLIIDDLGYVQQSREEMEVLFTLLAERYERGSVLLSEQLALQQVGADLQGRHDDGRRHRSPGPPQRDSGVERVQLSIGERQESSIEVPLQQSGYAVEINNAISAGILIVANAE